MYELDKQAFGAFVANRRKAKGYTQRDLADKLYVSDKAVSKWERGLSVPDVSLLVPLAELLEVSVTELLEGRCLDTAAPMHPDEVESLVKKAITMADQLPEDSLEVQRRNFFLFFGCAAVGVALAALVWHFAALTETPEVYLFVAEAFGVVFGLYFWFDLPQKLPAYYDENQISFYALRGHGLRMNVPGMYFNNHNWPHLLRFLRRWSLLTMLLTPPLCAAASWAQTAFALSDFMIRMLLLAWMFGTLLGPMYYLGKKYEKGEK